MTSPSPARRCACASRATPTPPRCSSRPPIPRSRAGSRGGRTPPRPRRAPTSRAWRRSARGEHLDLVVEHLEAGPIGITGLSELAVRDRRAVIGSWLGRAWWGTGANQEAKALMCHLAFVVLGLERVGAYSNVEHTRSQRALERIGFRREGVLRSYHRHGDRLLDVVVFGLLREEWAASALPAVPVMVTGQAPPAFVLSRVAPTG